ncbi:GNAT family N-acetyltransferase [Vibrio breoganii]
MEYKNLDLSDHKTLCDVANLCLPMYKLQLDDLVNLFRWKHVANPFGLSLAIGAFDQKKLVAVRIFMRWEFSLNDTVLRAFRPVDTFTSPTYQRRGIFQKLTETALEVSKSQKIDLIFNTPNNISRNGYEKLGWRLARNEWVYVRVFSPFRIVTTLLLNKLLNKESKKVTIESFEQHTDFGTAFDTVFRSDKFSTNVNYDFLKWRYLDYDSKYVSQYREGNSILLYKINNRNGLRELMILDSFGFKDLKSPISHINKLHKADYLILKGDAKNIYSGTLFKRPSLDLYEYPISNSSMKNINLSIGDLESF